MMILFPCDQKLAESHVCVVLHTRQLKEDNEKKTKTTLSGTESVKAESRTYRRADDRYVTVICVSRLMRQI